MWTSLTVKTLAKKAFKVFVSRRAAGELKTSQMKNAVAAVAPNVPALYELHFGVPMAGAVLCALNTRLDAAMLATLLEQPQAKTIFVDYQFLEVVLQALEIVSCAKTKPIVRPEDECNPISVNYTSGSTGKAKGVVYSHRAAYLNSIAGIFDYDMSKKTVFLWTVDMFRCNGWCLTWAMAALGGTNICTRHVTAKAIFKAISLQKLSQKCNLLRLDCIHPLDVQSGNQRVLNQEAYCNSDYQVGVVLREIPNKDGAKSTSLQQSSPHHPSTEPLGGKKPGIHLPSIDTWKPHEPSYPGDHLPTSPIPKYDGRIPLHSHSPHDTNHGTLPSISQPEGELPPPSVTPMPSQTNTLFRPQANINLNLNLNHAPLSNGFAENTPQPTSQTPANPQGITRNFFLAEPTLNLNSIYPTQTTTLSPTSPP
ncbi:hypothetical protein RJ640_027831 [Escallonia rubra]|uniref:AMP-dependent synthetase/ligase domain-containing protein n=1 Tax=Escallonia rubra TaxID=112253 RepID=A0AA88RYC2_9ASTE|nr:hypothetical protein RJ640_027831 [Escallonia rubra]